MIMKNLLKGKLLYKLFFMLLISICIPIIIFSVISYYMSYRSIYNDYLSGKNNLNKQVAQNVEENFYTLKNQSVALYNYDNIADILNTDKENITDQYMENYHMVYGNLVSIVQGNSKLDGISLIDLDGEVKFYYGRNMAEQNLKGVGDEPWFGETKKANGIAVIVPPHVNIFTNSKDNVTSVCRVIMNPYDDSIAGVLKIDQDVAAFDKIFATIDKLEGEVDLVYSGDGTLFYASRELKNTETQDIFALTQKDGKQEVFYELGGKKQIVTYGDSAGKDWWVVSLVYFNNVAEKAAFIKNINIVLMVILLIVCAVISVLVSITINVPIRKLTDSIKLFQEGDMSVQVNIKRNDEFGTIAQTFNQMVMNIRKLINEKYEMKILKKQAQLENYQSQINPHFLFNTLNSIKAMALKGEGSSTADMIQCLSDNFRYSLNRGVYLVSFREELEYINQYIALQMIRFSDRYTISKEINLDVMENEIPRMVLQPIVENAFHHGLENSSQKGEIQILAQNVGMEFIIYISNNGAPIEAKKLQEINQQLSVDEEQYMIQNKDKIGIFNVNARIKYHYGEQYGLKIICSNDELTTVRVRLPKLKFEDDKRER